MKLATIFYNRTDGIRQWRRRSVARLQGASLASGVLLEGAIQCIPGMHDGQAGRISVGTQCKISTGAVFHAYGGSISLAENVFIGPHVVMYGHGGITIGKNSLIAMHTALIAAEHAIPPLGTPIRSKPDTRKPITIGEDVWIGAGSCILAGVTIGDGCVIAAGSVVRQSLQPGTIVAGVPARTIRTRDS